MDETIRYIRFKRSGALLFVEYFRANHKQHHLEVTKWRRDKRSKMGFRYVFLFICLFI